MKFYGPGLPAPPPLESVQKSAKIYGKNQQNAPNMLIDHETAVHGFEGAKLGQNPAVQIDYDGENPISIGAKSPLQRPHQRIPAYRDLHGFSDSLVVNGGGSGRMLSDKKYHQNEALIEMDWQIDELKYSNSETCNRSVYFCTCNCIIFDYYICTVVRVVISAYSCRK